MFTSVVPVWKSRRIFLRVLSVLSVLVFQPLVFAAEPSSSDARILAELDLEKTTSLLFLPREEKRVAFRNIDRIMPTRPLKTGPYVHPLGSQLKDFSAVTYTLDGQTYSIDQYMKNFDTMGLLIVRDDNIQLEKYALGNDESSLWISFSVSKSITSMLLGAAVKDGYIKSLDDPITDYLPLLKGSAYDKASIKNVLQMSSGVAWNEDYEDPKSDVSQAGGLSGVALYSYLSKLPSESIPGEVFNYNTGETNLVGSLVRAAIGNNLATYGTTKIWKAFGMESQANWPLNAIGGTELGGCCIAATLRDYARIGLFAMQGGVAHDGTRILPDDWMQESTTPSKGYEGYGYLWWLEKDSYSALGIFGQSISIHPATKTVIAIHSAWPRASNAEQSKHRAALIAALMIRLDK